MKCRYIFLSFLSDTAEVRMISIAYGSAVPHRYENGADNREIYKKSLILSCSSLRNACYNHFVDAVNVHLHHAELKSFP